MTEIGEAAAADSAGEKPRDIVAAVAARVRALSTGDRALLRRMSVEEPGRAAGVVIGLLARTGLSPEAMRPETLRRWALLAHVAAVLSGTGRKDPHSPRNRLGRALSEAGYSENRLMRLTAARGPALRDQIVRAARYLAAAGGEPVDLRTLHGLTSPDEAKADEARLDLARGFYAAEHAQSPKGDDQ
jgi:CRISPR type I-E-associated protein CasB/Cse2